MIVLINMQVLNEKNKQLYPAQNPTTTSPLVSWEATYCNILLCILLHVHGERKGSLPGIKLVKPGHYLENSLICMIF